MNGGGAMTRAEAGTLLLRAHDHVWKDRQVELRDRTAACNILWACLVQTIEEGWREEDTAAAIHEANKPHQPDLIPPRLCPSCGESMPYAGIPGPEEVCDGCLLITLMQGA